jgi:hypothetical protein
MLNPKVQLVSTCKVEDFRMAEHHEMSPAISRFQVWQILWFRRRALPMKTSLCC